VTAQNLPFFGRANRHGEFVPTPGATGEMEGQGPTPQGDYMIKSLMPCECGGEPTARSLSYLRGRWFWVVCNTCQARSADRTTLDEAAADWNLRGKRNQAEARQPRAKIRRQA
jgi:hypothetical protein